MPRTLIVALMILAWPVLGPVARGQDDARLQTRWAAEVTPDNVHPEYPRPQLVRDEWQSLNGEWHYAIRPPAEQRPDQADGPILVPFPVESSLSGVQRRVAPDQTLWYWRNFEVPEVWRGGRLRLHFGAVDWAARVWVNGREVGVHRGGYDAFSFDVTAALVEGPTQRLEVAVTDPTDAGTQPRGKQVRDPHGIWYTPTTGIWQSVWLEPVPQDFIERVRLTPHVSTEELHAWAWVSGWGARHRLRVVAYRGDGKVAAVEVPGEDGPDGGPGLVPFVLPVPSPELWSPSNPALYDLTITLLDGDQVVDEVQSYFAMRSIDVRPAADGIPRLHLNGEPLFQLGTLDQGFWPDGLYTAPGDEALRYDVEVTRDLGFNMIRKHVKVEPDRWYYWCDRLGVLVWQDMPSGDRYIGGNDPDLERTPESAAQFETELGQVMDTLHNHPCVVMWVPFNEGWGQFDTARVGDWIRQRDPSRPVNSASGWTDRGTGQVHDIHAYPGPAIPPLGEGRALVLGEFGGLGLPLPGHTWQDEKNWGYRSYEDEAALTDAYVELLQRLRPLIAEGLSAAVYTQTTDVEIEVNGLMTYDRAVIKLDAARVREANADLHRPPPRIDPVAATSRREAQTWRYTFDGPAEDWFASGFDDSTWSEGPGGFGTAGTPGAVVRTEWTGDHIWLRRRFEWDGSTFGDLHLRIHHDEDTEVYLNGQPVAELTGYTTSYVLAPARDTLQVGENTLAVYCHQTGGGQYIDVGVVFVSEVQEDEGDAHGRSHTRHESGASPSVRARLEPVPFTDVRLTEGFWADRLRTNRDVTIDYDFARCEDTGRLANFAVAGGIEEGDFQGIYFNDSDVYKVIEGAARSLATHPDPELDRFLDELIQWIAAAQEDDGYLYTIRTIRGEAAAESGAGKQRWENLRHAHELYNVGHLYEAAVAHFEATGKRSLLEVAIRNADLVLQVFGPGEGQLRDVPGHEEIEIGLIQLARVTRNARYRELARFFVDQRGNPDREELFGAYCQDHQPVFEQRAAVGHAVRAGYLYCAMADLARLGDSRYVPALDALWNDVVAGKMYLTGGIGARRGGEAFGDAYELPNASAYNETCAAIAFALWNHRMFLLHRDAKYLDVLERVIYNGFLSGVSRDGDRFFYPNPLAFDGQRAFNQGERGRAPWFGCSCCPVNVVRFVPSVPGFVYASTGDALSVNLFATGEADVEVGGQPVRVRQHTNYPWDGDVIIGIDPAQATTFRLYVRIPGWARGQPVPGDLYRYRNPAPASVRLSVNGEEVPVHMQQGFAVLDRAWLKGDVVALHLDMPVRRVLAHDQVSDDVGRVALERGPLVYCVEGVDSDGSVDDLVLDDEARVVATYKRFALDGSMVLELEAQRARRDQEGRVVAEPTRVQAVPYHQWAHREVGPMAVWLARDLEHASVPPPPTLASTSQPSASHVWSGDTVTALNDQLVPRSSIDHDLPRHTWWDHRGTVEWVQYDFPGPSEVSGVEVYWFDDTGRGACRVPVSWRVLARDGEQWRPVEGVSAAGVEKDTFNRVTFSPVTTTALRLEVTLQDEWSSGILEWRVIPGGAAGER